MEPGSRFTVLHYLGYDSDGGGIVSVVRALAEVKDHFDSVLGVNPGFAQRRTPALPVLTLPAVRGEQNGPADVWRARTAARAVRAWLREDRARIFHGHSRAGLLVALWLRHWDEPRVVASVHCYGRHRWFYRWAARRLAPRLFWLSPAMKRHYGLGDGSWGQCVPGCVPASPPAVRRSRGPAEPVRLVGIGALVRWKNWHLVSEALARLPDPIRRRLRFTHIGAGDGSADARAYEAELRARTAQPDLDGLVEWRGEQPGAAALLAEADCLVVASRREPFSVAMLEALAAGVPVLAADDGGARDLIRPGANGWLFAAGDTAALAMRLRELVETPALAQVVIEKEDLRRFTAPVVAAQWREIYRGLAGT